MATDEYYIAPQTLYAQLATDAPPFGIDVRPLQAYVEGHIPVAHHIPVGELEARLGEVPRDRPIVAY